MSRLEVLTDQLHVLFAEWVAAQTHNRKLQRFYNSILALPYEPRGNGITDGVLREASTGAPVDSVGGTRYDDEVVTMGVDVGTLLHVSISVANRRIDPIAAQRDASTLLLSDDEFDDEIGVDEPRPAAHDVRRCAVFVGTVRSFEQLVDLIGRFRVTVCVIDAQPETRKAQELRDQMFNSGTCSVWLCRFFPKDKVGREDYGMTLDYESHVVTVDRTQLLDATLDDLTSDRRVLPSDSVSIDQFFAQMQAPKRVLNARGDRYVWSEGTADDHYRLSDAYDRVAFDLLQRGGEFHVV